MIFATVGTHEDAFDRLILALDAWAKVHGEAVIIQAGYTKVPAPNCTVHAMMAFDAVQQHMAHARVVVTHGGPASIMQAFAHGKVPIVVPRQSKFHEHVDDHQVRFSQKLGNRVCLVLDIADLPTAIRDLPPAGESSTGSPKAQAFAIRFDALCEQVLTRPPKRAPRVLRWMR